jgi:hypothetical protein
LAANGGLAEGNLTWSRVTVSAIVFIP